LPRNAHFNFEKVSKRQHLDIASVNSAILIEKEGNIMTKVHLSAGGVYPWPFYAEKTSTFLTGKELSVDGIFEAVEILLSEIAPISDVRGSKAYKSLLLRQLFLTHFAGMFPEDFTPELLFSKLMA
jgi:xanthine dehydrogenase small subunit